MKHRFQISLLILILYGIAGSWSAVFEPAIANAATKENLKKSSPEIQFEEGYIPLFQNDLSNAIVEPGGWVFENGNLTPAGKGHIWTKERYGDFVLKLEFQTTETTESGVFLRCDMIKNWLNWTIEVQIQQAIVEYDKYNCGAIFDILAPSKNMIKRPGDWNSYTISCKGNLVDVILNGELVSRMDLNFFDVGHKTLDGTRSKLETPFADLSREGHIGFQYNGQPVWFRNIRIKPLEDIHLTDVSLPSKSASKAAEILFFESDGICIMEAEHGLISQNLDWINWEKKTDASASNGEYMITPIASERAWK